MPASVGYRERMLAKIIERGAREGGWTVDARGLMPIERARETLAKNPQFTGVPVEEGRTPEEKQILAVAWQQYCALLSLEDDFEKALLAMRFEKGGGIFQGRLLQERFGADVMWRFILGFVEGGRLDMVWPDTHELVVERASEETFELILKLQSIEWNWAPRAAKAGVKVAELPEANEKLVGGIVPRWIADFAHAHPEIASALLSRRAAAKDKRAKKLLKELGLAERAPLSEKEILDALDKAAAQGPMEWPPFDSGIEDDPQTWEYFGLRMLAARAEKSDEWGVVFERISGSYDQYQPTRLQRYFYGSRVKDPGWDTGRDQLVKVELVAPDEANAKDLKAGLGCERDGDAKYNLKMRAYVDAHPGALFTSADELLALLDLGPARIVADTHAFAHVVGARKGKKAPWIAKPSKSATYQSLAKALVARDPKLFQPGDSNLDFRLHATHPLP